MLRIFLFYLLLLTQKEKWKRKGKSFYKNVYTMEAIQ